MLPEVIDPLLAIINLSLSLGYCHGAHTREEQGHADEDVNSNNSLYVDIKAGLTCTETPGNNE